MPRLNDEVRYDLEGLTDAEVDLIRDAVNFYVEENNLDGSEKEAAESVQNAL